MRTNKIIQIKALDWPILRQDQTWENSRTEDFMESFQDFSPKYVLNVHWIDFNIFTARSILFFRLSYVEDLSEKVNKCC